MGPIKHPKRDPEQDNKPVQGSLANYSQNNPGSVYILKKNTVNWDLLLQESTLFGECACAKGKPVDPEQGSKKRIMQVTETDETLNYSKKTAEAARKREEELRKQPVIQLEETKKKLKSPT